MLDVHPVSRAFELEKVSHRKNRALLSMMLVNVGNLYSMDDCALRESLCSVCGSSGGGIRTKY